MYRGMGREESLYSAHGLAHVSTSRELSRDDASCAERLPYMVRTVTMIEDGIHGYERTVGAHITCLNFLFFIFLFFLVFFFWPNQ
jgi:hypothetical protein